MSDSPTRKIALVTGASRGIGAATAVEKGLTLNLTQAFWAMQEAGKIMLAAGSGAVA
ncbi:hypothetical protein BH23ACT9_BH23ACT9_04530 [soil metagenome]